MTSLNKRLKTKDIFWHMYICTSLHPQDMYIWYTWFKPFWKSSDFCMRLLHASFPQQLSIYWRAWNSIHRSLRALSDGFLFVSPLWGPPWNLNAPFWKGVGGFFFWWPEKVGGQVGKKGLKTRWPRWWLNHPIEKICSSKWVHLPQIGVNI